MNLGNCIDLHHTKPWIPYFDRVLIAPAQHAVDHKFFGRSVRIRQVKYSPLHPTRGSLEIPELSGKLFYEPTEYFWQVHCRVSHTNGMHCNSKIHTDFLGTDSQVGQEFYYGHLLTDDPTTVYLEGSQDFQAECDYFAGR